MMTEISLNVLDITENSTRAGADLINIDVTIDNSSDRLTITIEDNGCGMSSEQIVQAEDPFFTTRTTRSVGLGISLFKMSAELTGGSFFIVSEPNKGTTVCAEYVLSHIDRMPLGDINATIHTLITCHPDTDFIYTYTFDRNQFTLDTREFREILGDIPFNTPDVSAFIKDYLSENKAATDGGVNV